MPAKRTSSAAKKKRSPVKKKQTVRGNAAGKKAAGKKRSPKKIAGKKRAAKKGTARKRVAKKGTAKKRPSPKKRSGPKRFRVRIRMYRQGLGDCFLLTFPRKRQRPFQLLIDCGALRQKKAHMTRFVGLIEEAVKETGQNRGRLDVVVGTHEHKDHLSGFNQGRAIFDRLEIGAVWLGWTENPDDSDAQRLSESRSLALKNLRRALASPRLQVALDRGPLSGITDLMAFTEDEDAGEAPVGARTIAQALEYLRARGNRAAALKYWEPGEGPIALDGVAGVRVFVLGPPREKELLLGSEVKEEHKRDDVVYHLAADGGFRIAALRAAIESQAAAAEHSGAHTQERDRYEPFPPEHAIRRLDSWFSKVASFVERTYDASDQAWRQIEDDWLASFGQLALKLDNDTNNTSLVLAFEMEPDGDVLLFVGDAQVGNWLSWKDVKFALPDEGTTVDAHDLLRRTVFYKVGHHASHNATLKKGGMELMKSDRLVAFIPLDENVAAQQGRKDPETGKPRGWEMPAGPLYRALKKKAADRVVISDAALPLPPAAEIPEIVATADYIDYYYV